MNTSFKIEEHGKETDLIIRRKDGKDLNTIFVVTVSCPRDRAYLTRQLFNVATTLAESSFPVMTENLRFVLDQSLDKQDDIRGWLGVSSLTQRPRPVP